MTYGRKLDPDRIGAGLTVDRLVDDFFLAYNGARLREACQLMARKVLQPDVTVGLSLSGALTPAGLGYAALVPLVEAGFVDWIVSTGANIVDQDFFEGLGFRHWQGTQFVDDNQLRDLQIDRIYDTYIDEDDLRDCDARTKEIFDAFEPGAYSSREFIEAMGAYLANNPRFAKNESLVKTAYLKRIPIFVPAFSDCSAGFGIVLQQTEAIEGGRGQVAFDVENAIHPDLLHIGFL